MKLLDVCKTTFSFKFNKQKVIKSVVTVSVLLLFLALLGYAINMVSNQPPPQKVRVSNVTDRSVTVSWVTQEPVKGMVMYATKSGMLGWVEAISGKQLAYDDRDVMRYEIEQSHRVYEELQGEDKVSFDAYDLLSSIKPQKVKEKGAYYVHHVTIENLEPETEYYFKVGCGVIYSGNSSLIASDVLTDMGAMTFQTTKALDNPLAPSPTYGGVLSQDVVNIDTQYVVRDGVVYMFVNDWDGGVLLSAPLNTDGKWYIDLTTARDIEGEMMLFDENSDKSTLFVEGGRNGDSGLIDLSMDQDAPAETVVLGKGTIQSLLDIGVGSVGPQNVVVDKRNELVFRCEAGCESDCESSCHSGCDGSDYPGACHSGCGHACSELCAGNTHPNPPPSDEPIADDCDPTCDECSDFHGQRCVNGQNQICDSVVKCGQGRMCWVNGGDACPNGGGQEGNENPVPVVPVGCKCPGCGGCCDGVELLGGGNKDGNGNFCCTDGWNTGCAHDIDGGEAVEGEIPSCVGIVADCTAEDCAEQKQNCIVDGVTESVPLYEQVSCIGTGDNAGDLFPYWVKVECQVAEESICHVAGGELCMITPCGPGKTPGACPQGVGEYEKECHSGEGEGCVSFWIIKDVNCSASDATGVDGPCPTGEIVSHRLICIGTCYDSNDPSKLCVGGAVVSGTSCENHSDGKSLCCKGTVEEVTAIPVDSFTDSTQLHDCWWYWDTDNSCGRSDLCNSSGSGYNPGYRSLSACQEAHPTALHSQPSDLCCKVVNGECKREEKIRIDKDGRMECPIGTSTYNCDYYPVCKQLEGGVSSGDINICYRVVNVNDPMLNSCYEVFEQVEECTVTGDLAQPPSGLDLCDPGQGFIPPTPVKNFFDLVTPTYADEKIYVISEGYIIEPKTDGVYSLSLPDRLEPVEVVMQGGHKYVFFEDRNGNGQQDEDEIEIDLSEGVVEITYDDTKAVHKKSLQEGMNFVSFDKLPAKSNSCDFISAVNVANNVVISQIAYFDAAKSQFVVTSHRADVGSSVAGNCFALVPGRGYIIKAFADTEIAFEGFSLMEPAPVQFSNVGWSLIGVNGSNTEYTAESLLDSINAVENLSVNNVTRWRPESAKYDGLQKEKDESSIYQVYGFDFPVLPGVGYFVRVATGNGQWTP